MIGSLVTNTYDEFGDPIVLNDFDYHNWAKGSEYANIIRKATPFQISAMVLSVTLVLGLFVYAANLHRKLVHRVPWIPPNTDAGYNHFDSHDRGTSFARGGSGIVANRSFGESSQTGGQGPSAAPAMNSHTGPSVMA